MISADDYAKHDATGLAELVRRREVSAHELLEAAIARAEQVQPQLNVITTRMYQIARERAESEPEGALGGVPFVFHTIGVDDGIAMGHQGMLWSLPSRELIAAPE